MFLAFEFYYQAKKRPIKGHVCLTYCLLHEAVMAVAILVSVAGVWVENTLHPRASMVQKTPLQIAQALCLITLIGFVLMLIFALAVYPYVKKKMENGYFEEVEARKAKKLKEKQEREEKNDHPNGK